LDLEMLFRINFLNRFSKVALKDNMVFVSTTCWFFNFKKI